MGRPSKLTHRSHEGIVRMIAFGSDCEVAARANGVDPATYHQWMKRGNEAPRDDTG